MSEQMLLELTRQIFYTAVLLTAPMLLVALLIGIVVSILQTITNIQEQTLVFIPKMLGVMLTLFIAMPWMLKVLTNLTQFFFEQMVVISR